MRIGLLATAIVLAAAGQAAAAERAVPPGWLGVTVDGPIDADDASEWDRMPRAGVETVRAAFSWTLLQPRRENIDFASTDAVVTAAASRGLELLPVVQRPPAWAAAQRGVEASPPADPRDVRRIFHALVARYGPRGSFWTERPRLPRRPIRSWQVFNEPNLEYFWSVQPFAVGYTATLLAAERGIHAADPAATVVLGGLANQSWQALDSLYAAGARGAFDAVAVHPYTARPADVVRLVRYTRRVMRRNGGARLPIWITEFSWPAAAGRDGLNPPWADLDDAEQARRLERLMPRLVAARESLKIGRVLWYTWISAEDSKSAFDFSGLRRIRDGARRDSPALRIFRRWARRLEGCAKTTNSTVCR
jgi:hypothetical protein